MEYQPFNSNSAVSGNQKPPSTFAHNHCSVHFNGQHARQLSQDQRNLSHQRTSINPPLLLEDFVVTSPQRQSHTQWSPLTSPSARASNYSSFSGQDWRFSAASSNTSWSQFSDTSSFRPIAQTRQFLDGTAEVYGYQHDGSAPASTANPSNGTHRRRISQEKEHYLTCVSRIERSSNTAKNPKFWCTSCKKGFGEKYDWKRHEETYQERFEDFQCGLCKRAYFLDKDFALHHQRRHSCQTCAENQHIEVARRKRKGRSGWGCGFCLRYDTDWVERCRHIARHFKDGRTMDNWTHSQVILSLLEQPLLWNEWNSILASKQEHNPTFSWNVEWTGRAEGYPDIDCPPQLQDLLEWFTPDQDAAAIARHAYELGHLQENSHVSQHSLYVPGSEPQLSFGDINANGHYNLATNVASAGQYSNQKTHPAPFNKELPAIPSECLAPAPHVENGVATSVHTSYNAPENVSWNRLGDILIPDELLPDIPGLDSSQIDFSPLGGDFVHHHYNL